VDVSLNGVCIPPVSELPQVAPCHRFRSFSNNLGKKATGYHRLVCMSFCDKTAPVTKSLASVDNLKRSLSFGILRTGAVVKAFFSISKAFCCSMP